MEIIFRILQSSKLGTLLFNIFLGVLFVIINNTDIANYGDDNTPHIIDDNIDDLIKSFKEASSVLFQWFDNNLFRNNSGKCHLIISSYENVTVHVGEHEIENSKCEKFLGVKIYWKFNFDDHIYYVCETFSRKRNTLAKIAPFI